jgi:hypothetical protein
VPAQVEDLLGVPQLEQLRDLASGQQRRLGHDRTLRTPGRGLVATVSTVRRVLLRDF